MGIRRCGVGFLGLLVTALVCGASAGFGAAETAVDCGSGASLQAAINTAAAGTILDISGTCKGTFTIGKSLVLRGVAGAVLDGQRAGTTLTITKGKVRVTRMTITGGGYGDHVGILNAGTLMAVRVTVTGNVPGDDGNGGIQNSGTLVLQRSTVAANTGDDTAGVANFGTATVDRTTIGPNGGVGITTTGSLTLTDSTVMRNHATYVGGIENSGTMSVLNSTIANNDAFNGSGAGIVNDRGGTLTVTRSTISGNTADEIGGGIYNDGTATVTATILAGNTDENGPEVPSDCIGSVISNGYNLFGTPCGQAQPTDFTGAIDQPLDPILKALGSYGGPTQTMVPRPTSPAVNAIPIGAKSSDGTVALCPSSGTTDQRGIPRPQGSACDIGAVERKPKE